MTVSRVLVTGAGGPAGVAVIRSLLKRDDLEVFAADMDGWASALYLVPAERRRIIPAGLAPEFVDAIIALVAE
ncbi:MAG: biotin carboxylase, partial [Leifsonia flava]